MEMKPGITFELFQPSHEWVRGEGFHHLLLNLEAGFEKDQIRVRVDNYGNLRITGERPLRRSRWIRFCSDFRIPSGSAATGISAKFDDGRLRVTIPAALPTRPSRVPADAAAADKSTTASAGDTESEAREEAKIRCGGGRRRGDQNIKWVVLAVVVFSVVLPVFYIAYWFYVVRNWVEVREELRELF